MNHYEASFISENLHHEKVFVQILEFSNLERTKPEFLNLVQVFLDRISPVIFKTKNDKSQINHSYNVQS